jgi:hypothetical protein
MIRLLTAEKVVRGAVDEEWIGTAIERRGEAADQEQRGTLESRRPLVGTPNRPGNQVDSPALMVGMIDPHDIRSKSATRRRIIMLAAR